MSIFAEKKENSSRKLGELRERLLNLDELRLFPNLAIFTTGSYARDEASTHSDIDLFFLNSDNASNVTDLNINSVRMFAKVIEIATSMGFPKFSNDGAYLKILEAPSILENLGNSSDDYLNNFTARLLLILESKPLFGESQYDEILRSVLNRYFEDYPDHPNDFRPTFLVNDIVRFWKTLCLNYENKRNQRPGNDDAKIAQKIKNLKLKFSRLLTCFGSICYIASENGSIGPTQLVEMTKLTPLERLNEAANRYHLDDSFQEAKRQYEWFLELTNVSEMELKMYFSQKENRVVAFARADEFGKAIYEITLHIASETGYLRYLVV